jgi:hypothetical protein
MRTFPGGKNDRLQLPNETYRADWSRAGYGRVYEGSYLPPSPTDPDVPDYRIRLFILWTHCVMLLPHAPVVSRNAVPLTMMLPFEVPLRRFQAQCPLHLFLQRVPLGRFPCFISTIERSISPPSLSSGFVAFTFRHRLNTPSFAPFPGEDVSQEGHQEEITGSPTPDSIQRR